MKTKKTAKTALTYDEQVQQIMEEAVLEARLMINEQSDRMRASNDKDKTAPQEYQGETERKQITDHVNQQRDVKLEQLKVQLMIDEANCYMWMEKSEGVEDKSRAREAGYKHLFLIVPPNSLGVYKKGQEFTTANQHLISDLMASARQMYR